MSAQRARTHEVEIHGLGHDGRGVGRLDGKAVFVTGALPGERVTACIERHHARFDEARCLAVLRPAPERTEPPCPHFGSCGGCSLQHLAAPAQLSAHQRHLESTLARIARTAPRRWLEPVASQPWGYRSRARLAPCRDADGRGSGIGFRREDSRHVEALASCRVLDPALQRLLEPLGQLVRSLSDAGCLHEVLLASGEPGAALALDCARAPCAADRERVEVFCALHGLALGLRVRGGAPAWQGDPAPLAYAPAEGLSLGFAPWHFSQANRAVNRALVAAVLDLLQPRPDDRALDLFCGIGNFSLPLARRVARVTGIEAGVDELARARANAADNDCGNTQFLQADLAEDPAAAPWTRERADLVVMDPPRAGAAALVPLLRRLAPRRICYVSCDPATFARDAAALVRAGFSLDAAGVLDMFPQTAHFETLALFTR